MGGEGSSDCGNCMALDKAFGMGAPGFGPASPQQCSCTLLIIVALFLVIFGPFIWKVLGCIYLNGRRERVEREKLAKQIELQKMQRKLKKGKSRKSRHRHSSSDSSDSSSDEEERKHK